MIKTNISITLYLISISVSDTAMQDCKAYYLQDAPKYANFKYMGFKI